MRSIGVLGLLLLTSCASVPTRHGADAEDLRIAPRTRVAHAGEALRRRPQPVQSVEEAPAWGTRSSPAADVRAGAADGPAQPSASAEEHAADNIVGARRVTSAPPVKAGAEPAPAASKDATREHHADKKVQVAGIEGTLANFDVRVTMEGKAREFGACHAPRLRKVPSLSGSVEFKIRVLADGSVERVELPSSDVGDRALERCFSGVIMATTFPKPRGGDANVTYTMSLSPSRPSREPEQWDPERIRHVLAKRANDVRDTCDLSAPRAYRTTVYVNRRGKVIAAGVAGKADSNGAFDCIAEAVRKWPMPKAKKKALAKVTFAMVGQS